MSSDPEVYKKAFWRDLPKRSRGRKDHPAARVKAAFSDYIRKHPELSSSAGPSSRELRRNASRQVEVCATSNS